MRLFAAVIPPPAVLDHLDVALRSVAGHGMTGEPAAPLRWTDRETWHLTVAFYGELPDGSVPELRGSLATVAASGDLFDLRLRGAGMFARRTIWVGAGGDVESMAALTSGAVEAGLDAGARPDDRLRSRAHLTVGRITERGDVPRGRATRRRATDEPRDRRPDVSMPEAVVRALSVYEGPGWTVDLLVLVESRPGAGAHGGPLYTTVDTFALGGA